MTGTEAGTDAESMLGDGDGRGEEVGSRRPQRVQLK